MKEILESLQSGARLKIIPKSTPDNAWPLERQLSAAEINSIISALATPPASGSPAGVPEGWRLVPKKITSEMLRAWVKKAAETTTRAWEGDYGPDFDQCWRAALAAAPSPPVPAQDVGVEAMQERLTRAMCHGIGECECASGIAVDFSACKIVKRHVDAALLVLSHHAPAPKQYDPHDERSDEYRRSQQKAPAPMAQATEGDLALAREIVERWQYAPDLNLMSMIVQALASVREQERGTLRLAYDDLASARARIKALELQVEDLKQKPLENA